MAGSEPFPSNPTTASPPARTPVRVVEYVTSIPVQDLEDVLNVLSHTSPQEQLGRGQHRFEYRSTLGNRINVSCMTRLDDGSVYTKVAPGDTMSGDGAVWRHNGTIRTNDLGWSRHPALMAVTHGSGDPRQPSAEIEVTVQGDAPFSEIITARQTIPLS